MKRLAIIPARGGSKRIPRKNIKDFLGKPIIAYSIENAIESGLFDEVMVSTDDEEIANVAQKYGATVPFMRSKESSDDMATTNDVLDEVFDYYTKHDINYVFACCIYPCTPLLTMDHLKEAFSKLQNDELDSVFSIQEFSSPIQRALGFTDAGRVNILNDEYRLTRSQDLENAYHDAGQFYWMKVSTYMEKRAMLTENTGAILMSEMEAHDMDTIEDWKITEFKYQYRCQRN